MTSPKPLWRAALAALLMLCSGASAAAEPTAFETASRDAYRHYRGAMSYLRTGNLDLAALELEDAIAKWGRLLADYGAAPPEAFADDPEWSSSLAGIGTRLGQALTELDGSRPDAAAQTLAPIREELAALRRRNGVTFFSDHADALSAAMAALWRYRDAPPDLEDDAQSATLRDESAELRAAVVRVRRAAPPAIAADPQFQRLTRGSLDALDRVDAAVRGKDAGLLYNTLGELQSFERIFWLEFG